MFASRISPEWIESTKMMDGWNVRQKRTRGSRWRTSIYIIHLFIKINIERFLLGCGNNKVSFSHRASSCERYTGNSSGVLRWEPSGTHPGEVGCLLSYPAHLQILYLRRWLSEGGGDDASQSIIFTFFTYSGGVIPMGERGRLRRTSKINLVGAGHSSPNILSKVCIGSKFR